MTGNGRVMHVRVGTSGYSYAGWKGAFYPAGLPATKMLGYYAGRLAAVEINNTFYKTPTEQVLAGWAAKVPPDFRFALKASRYLTHGLQLRDAAEPLERLFALLATLGEKLGPLLVQVPPFLQKDLPLLRGFLAAVPRGRKVAMELLHPSWNAEDVRAVLREHDAALCVTDTDEAPAADLPATADWVYLRLRKARYAAPVLRAWAARLRGGSWRDAYVFFKHEDAGVGPKLALGLTRALGPAAVTPAAGADA